MSSPPSYGDFEVIKEAVIELGKISGASVRSTFTSTMVHVERLYADMDFLAWPLLQRRIVAKVKYNPETEQERMLCAFTDNALNNTKIGHGIRHTYVIGANSGEVDEFWHTVVAVPKILAPVNEPKLTDAELDSSYRGEKILRSNLEGQLDLSKHECIVLYDRIAEFSK